MTVPACFCHSLGCLFICEELVVIFQDWNHDALLRRFLIACGDCHCTFAFCLSLVVRIYPALGLMQPRLEIYSWSTALVSMLLTNRVPNQIRPQLPNRSSYCCKVGSSFGVAATATVESGSASRNSPAICISTRSFCGTGFNKQSLSNPCGDLPRSS